MCNIFSCITIKSLVTSKYEPNKYVEFILVNEYTLGVLKMIIALIHLHLALCPEFYIVAIDKHFPSIKIAAIYSAINIPRDGEEDS